ncbi:hypothetical protein BC829DRAFT_22817 [Chytridium lagenaria]|nr:hypothetical protein BC829DRAFT_22817 [Chytridium lagenaria]
MAALFHSIVFHRGFALTKPVEVDVDFLELTYVRVDDAEVEKIIDDRISTFIKSLDYSGGYGPLQTSIAIMFLERRAKKYWFTKTEEEICWEHWTVNISISQSRTEKEQIEAKRSIEKNLFECLMNITQKCNENKDHVPPIVNNDTYPFPFQIVFNTNADANTWGGLIKGLINNTGPASLGI